MRTQLSATVPPELEPMFRVAQARVEAYFAARQTDIHQGIRRLGGNRHVLMRGDALGSEFAGMVSAIYGNDASAWQIAQALLFDLSHAIGQADARKFAEVMGLSDPLEILAVGPVYFAHAGFAHVAIQPGSRPSPDDDFVLYYRHENSFEGESWRTHGTESAHGPVCIVSAGYSSGWCSTAFGVPLVAVEHRCTALGDAGCDFVMAPPHRIEEYLTQTGTSHSLYVPRFFGRKRHDEHLKQLAYKDLLTGLSNRAFFMEMGQQLFGIAMRHEKALGLLFLDLDGFKAVNDRYGHAAGDQVLIEVARRIRDRVRVSDLSARLGGDEFAVLLPELESTEAMQQIAQDLIASINAPITHHGHTYHVGTSIGGGLIDRADESLEALLARADAAMYAAKAAGKNTFRLG